MSKRSGFAVEGKANRVAEFWLDKRDHAIDFKKLRKKVARRRSYFMATKKVLCQLYRGSEKFPRTEQMTVKEMSVKNRHLVKNKIKAMDQGKDRPLWQWRLSDKESFNCELKKYMLDL